MKKIIYVITIFTLFFLFVFGLSSCDISSSNKDDKNNITNSTTKQDIPSETNDTDDSTTNNSYQNDTTLINPENNTENSDIDDNVYFTITFKDYDGVILQTSNVKKGDTPTYNKSNPTKENDDNFSYTFSDWTPTISKASEDIVYTATYSSKALPYNVTINLNGGTSSTTKLNFKTDKMTSNMLPFDVVKKGYAFKGYELNGIKVYDENGNVVNNYKLSSNMTFKVIFEEAVTLTIYYTIYDPKTNKLINTYNTKPDLGTVSETKSYNYNTYVDLFANPKEGYTFVGWYINNQVLSNTSEYKHMMWEEDVTIEARFKYTVYDLKVWSNNSDYGQVIINNGNSQTFYNEETLQKFFTEKVTIVSYSKTNTRFLGWYDEDNKLVSPNPSYTFNMINRNYVLEAKWNYFNIEYDLDGGINNKDNPTYYNVDMNNIKLQEPTKDGYTFNGWEYNGNVITEIKTNNACHMKLKALWTYYTLTTCAIDSKYGDVSLFNNAKITKGKLITIDSSANPGYTFNGWYDGNELVSDKESYTFNMPATNLVYVAKWIPVKYKITLDNQTDGVIISGITSGNSYDYGSSIHLTATNVPSGFSVKWETNDGMINLKNEYNFIVPLGDTTITISIIESPYSRKGKKIYFGKYPQKKVSNDTLINKLNNMAGNLPTSTNKYNWIDYNYFYQKSINNYVEHFMFYQDIDYDNNGTYDYRGVYFTGWRPNNYKFSGTLNQANNGYETNTVYWFSYEIIEWDILSEIDGKLLILSNLIIDSQDYYFGYYSKYDISCIRNFLNNDFYNYAFNDLQKMLIDLTIVDNSASSTCLEENKNACNDTEDNIFLLSCKEASTYFKSETEKCTQGTDYAKCQGLAVWQTEATGKSTWWLRSPHYDYDSAYCVVANGKIGYCPVDDTYIGVRPACYINI